MKAWRAKRCVRRKLRGSHLLVVSGTLAIGYLCFLCSFSDIIVPHLSEFEDGDHRVLTRRLLALDNNTTNGTTAKENKMYPPELFTIEQLRQGAVVLYVIGILYMFVALAVVCDEFFVPALGVITEKLGISEDVAGATFMAAGGSAPELFTSLIGLFVAHNNVGIGTIVGSAVFNILFVIGMCAVVSKGVLKLTWWPLFRDCVFYSCSLAMLIGFFKDGQIDIWESLLLLFWYFCYVTFMKFNHNIEPWVKSKLCKNRVTTVESASNQLIQHEKTERSTSLPILHGGTGRFRHGVVQLMIQTIDPLGTGHIHERAVNLHAIASLKVVIDGDSNMSPNPQSKNGIPSISNGRITINDMETGFNGKQTSDNLAVVPSSGLPPDDAVSQATQDSANSEHEDPLEEEEEPLDISWPKTPRKRLTYILLAPIVFPLWITLPDVRRPEKKMWYPCSFIGSMLWIAFFTYLMVWWADSSGEAAGIPSEVMGITFLAAGTSVPDLITSVIVARKGYGDMAVSSSVGSNLFDVTVGLPFPWLLSAIIYWRPISVDSQGLYCSVVLLFLMLLFVVCSVAAFKWKMSKGLGVAMFVLYSGFLATSVLLVLGFFQCPF
ncbi:sodium/potassium/calcium exchanger Nckx30C isoform X2 [Lingula anatina]|uniref:Sodium/potassium/calcium exchanger Nckx30C isoform X2 n=1 Tax=Lingula anatina TaxID=7574 RepID=A0A1S3IZH8_LINAN|nr:sodium/potassium/calcium exchanger Nckx30C isoform X2 [Lingula anatina]|eukprot:XP_013403406.1 sodium/potassium/calcium exchanger Nckx30C isoform X2 [Lingula anatina]